jgi:putative GTP pyrophosphokinase
MRPNNPGLEFIARELVDEIERLLLPVGIIYRSSFRIKSFDSIEEKRVRKGYTDDGSKKMQDLVGVRITAYFHDDLSIIKGLISRHFTVVGEAYDYPDSQTFIPLRKNFVCRLSTRASGILAEISSLSSTYSSADSTFELQLRSAFTDGWYEIDHAMRYKCKEDWEHYDAENRLFNGFLATIETADLSMLKLFENLMYKHYASANWSGMLRTKFRLRFQLVPLTSDLEAILNGDNRLAKRILQLDRSDMIQRIIDSGNLFPMTLDNILFFINREYLNDERVSRLTPAQLFE